MIELCKKCSSLQKKADSGKIENFLYCWDCSYKIHRHELVANNLELEESEEGK